MSEQQKQGMNDAITWILRVLTDGVLEELQVVFELDIP